MEGGFDPYSGLCKFLLTRILLRFYHDSRILRGNEDFPRPSLGLPREAPALLYIILDFGLIWLDFDWIKLDFALIIVLIAPTAL